MGALFMEAPHQKKKKEKKKKNLMKPFIMFEW